MQKRDKSKNVRKRLIKTLPTLCRWMHMPDMPKPKKVSKHHITKVIILGGFIFQK